MGKNHRHVKNVRAEKGKTKLKTRVKNEKTKFLPKGLNVTKTDFKIKSIIVPEQFKQYSDSELVSRRKLNVKDILSRLKHHNATVKSDCCEELKQIIGYHLDEIVEQYLAQILQGVSPLVLDREKKVRRNAIKILHIILERAPVEKIEPFFPILSSYLCCAMTDIDRFVQEDSLLILDGLLQHASYLVARGSDKILPNLFALISKLRTDSLPGRTLTVNLKSKTTNVKWHIQVLSRLYGFLAALVEEQRKSKVNVVNNGVVKNANDGNLVPLYYNPYAKNMITLSFDSKQKVSEDADVIAKNLQILMSLLCDIWLEVAPDLVIKKDGSDSTLLNSDTAAILTCILCVLYLLLQYTTEMEGGTFTKKSRNDFFTSHCQNFLTRVLNGFPYSQHAEKKRKSDSDVRKVLDIEGDPKCLRENLLIAYLFSVLNNKLSGVASVISANKILNYIDGCLTKRNYFNKSHMPYLSALTKTLLFENSLTWVDLPFEIDSFLNKLINAFGAMKQSYHAEIFNLLCKVIEVDHLNQCESYQCWLSKLPKFLCEQQISGKMLDVLLLIAKKNNEKFLQSLRENIYPIMDNFKYITIDECDDMTMEKSKILYLFYYIPKLTSEECEYLQNFVDSAGSNRYKDIVECIRLK